VCEEEVEGSVGEMEGGSGSGMGVTGALLEEASADIVRGGSADWSCECLVEY
jgi:hypothetical protein